MKYFKHVVFTFKEVGKLAFNANRWMLLGLILSSVLVGMASIPGFYIEKLILDTIIASIGRVDFIDALKTVGVLVAIRLFIDLATTAVSNYNSLLQKNMSWLLNINIDV